MGIQDRDYYWDKYKKIFEEDEYTSYRPNRPASYSYSYPYRRKRKRNWIFIVSILLLITAIWRFSSPLKKYIEYSQIVKTRPHIVYTHAGHKNLVKNTPVYHPIDYPKPKDSSRTVSGAIRIKADRQGHFRGIVFINDVPMRFLIDTGATKTVIPAKLASSARLPYGDFTQSNTAGGKITVRKTTISNLRLGNAVIHNLEARINEHLHEVLIGMNTLRYFKIMQNNGILTLIPNYRSTSTASNSRNSSGYSSTEDKRTFLKSTIIKKTVTCNKNNYCKTRYSDR